VVARPLNLYLRQAETSKHVDYGGSGVSEPRSGNMAASPQSRRRRLPDVIVVGLLLLPACLGSGARVVDSPVVGGFYDLSPRFSPDGSRIVFSSDRDGNDEIYAIGVDGMDLTRLTSSPAKDLDPSFSPDGTKIVFDSDRDGPVAIFAMNADGSDPVNLSRPKRPGDIFPSWSPDGAQIAYACGPSLEGLDICVMDSDGGGQRVLIGGPGSREWEPAWSPDGGKIAFVSNRTGDDEIYVMDANGRRIVRLTTNPGRDADPAWSPDGRNIAFDSDREGALSIFVMDARGANVTRLTESSGADASPSWSPDGTRIAFQREIGETSHIFVIDVDGSHLRQLTS
jgi:Tol biopolymer transport system component